jgi:hypothetical protein
MGILKIMSKNIRMGIVLVVGSVMTRFGAGNLTNATGEPMPLCIKIAALIAGAILMFTAGNLSKETP